VVVTGASIALALGGIALAGVALYRVTRAEQRLTMQERRADVLRKLDPVRVLPRTTERTNGAHPKARAAR
jgi:hypothetical protein